MTSIPGLSSMTENTGKEIEIASFKGTFTIPEAQALGHCRKKSEFEEIGRIRKGQFGHIYKCKNKSTKEKVSVKKYLTAINHDGGVPAYVIREAKVLNVLKHCNIENLLGSVADKELNSHSFALEFCPFSLTDLLEWRKEALAEKHIIKGIMQQLFEGLQYIHENSVIHRNLNPDNILFHQTGYVKISGFADSRFIDPLGNMTPRRCKLEYRAPELLLQSKEYDFAVDMWSVACIFAQLLLQKLLFTGSCELEIWKNICEVLGSPYDAIWPGFSNLCSAMNNESFLQTKSRTRPLKDLLKDHTKATILIMHKLLVYYPKSRLSASDCLKQFYFVESPMSATTTHISSLTEKNNLHKK